jgi:hypothetical protein
MKNLFAVAAFIFALALAIMAQTQPSPNTEIVWGYDQNCSAYNDASVKAASPKCERVETNQGTFYITAYKGVSVAMTYVFPRPYIRATIQVTNRSGNEISFDPGMSQVNIFQSQTAYLKGKNQIQLSKNITAEDAKALYIKDQKNLRVTIPFGGSLDFPSTNTQSQSATVTYTTANGRITGVSTGVPNSPVRQDQTRINVGGSTMPSVPSGRPQMVTKENRIDSASLALYGGGFKPGNIADQQKAAGYVFFELVKDQTRYRVFRIAVGGVVFVFPEETLQDKKKLAKKK